MPALLLATFWLGVSLVGYTWLIYPTILVVAARIKRRRERTIKLDTQITPVVTLLVTAHNEERVLTQKLRNAIELVYPQDRLRILIASDGSTDSTVEIARHFAEEHRNIFVYHQREHKGKTLTQNAAVERSHGEIIFFTDAGTMLDPQCLKKMIRHFADPTVGCVAAQIVWTNEEESGVAQGGGLYWRLEKMLWTYESRLGIMAWAPGAAMAVRRELFEPMDGRYGEDCVVPLDVVRKGKRVVYEPEAIAYETLFTSPRAELKGRIRISLRTFTGTLSKPELLNPFKYPGIAWAIISHKLLRYLVPFALIGLFFSNLALAGQGLFYRITLLGQLVFYGSAWLGLLGEHLGKRVPIASAAFSFTLANLAILLGVLQALMGKEILAYRRPE